MKFNTKVYQLPILCFGLFLLNSCATFHEQKGKDMTNSISDEIENKKLNHKFILIGDGGNANDTISEPNFKFLKERISNSNENTTVLFLGDNIYPKGLPDSLNVNRNEAIEILNKQLDLVKDFKGQTFFLAGNHDWYSGLDGLIEQKNYVASALNSKKGFMPRNYESIDKVEINDEITLITIDSEWFIQDWNKYNKMNHGSEFRSREDFFEEFRSLINKNQNKITLVAIHHPLFTGGAHGGYFSLRKHLFPYKNIPLPVFGSVINYLRKTTGGSPADTQYKVYQSLINRLKTIATNQDQVIFLSGHDHNLQYIEKDGIKQIISGSASKIEEARAVEPLSFSVGKFGYGVLNVYEDKETEINFYTTENKKEELAFRRSIYKEKSYSEIYPRLNQDTISTSIYSESETSKGEIYKFLFGKHFRDVYSTKIEVPVAYLDTLYGGLTPTISGGGNQSLSLRLVDKEGKEFVMRGLRKSPTQFLQSAVFKDIYVKDKVKNTYIIPFINDFYTTGHPYTPFIIGNFTNALGINHSNAKLYYIPKQNVLGKYNESFGDQMYMVEERPGDTQLELESFGKPDDIVSTQDVLFNLESDDKYSVDTEMYLRARIFDFLIGDWDRHADQWRWSVYEEEGKIIYKPIPRDRDQAFAKIDGNLLFLLKQTPALRHMQSFRKNFGHPRWITKTAFPLDKAFLQGTSVEQWKKVAQEVVEGISDELILETFSKLPIEVQNKESHKIQEVLKERRSKLVDFSEKYYYELMKFAIVHGTNKKNKIQINSTKDNVQVVISKLKSQNNEIIKSYNYDPNVTKEIWIYGLDNEDLFVATGDKSPILIRLMGGEDHDTYDIQSKNRIKIHDYKSDLNTIQTSLNTDKILRNNYELNQYDYRNVPLDIMTFMPDVGYNKDNGIMVGVNFRIKKQKYYHQPFSHDHQIRAKFDFATSGATLEYLGKYKDNSRRWFYQFDLTATTSNYTQNFFGFGNNSDYNEKLFKTNYNRVRTEQFFVKPSYAYAGRNGGSFLVGPTFESTKIIDTYDRFIDSSPENDDYKTQKYYGFQAKYEFENFNSKSNPTLGLHFMMHYGFRAFTQKFSENHSFIASSLGFIVPINQSESITFETNLYGKTMIGNNYHFYQAADLGSNNYLRGFRENRFIGRAAFAQSSDFNFKIAEINKGLFPLSIGLSTGFDYGKIWQDFEKSDKWHISYGGGIWFNVLETLRLKVNVYKSDEEMMFTFGFKVGI
ncbi:metallophosphoesterase [Paenimyroides tangerinum]|uniref:Metallophosphoesterase n=1 Tax=Paenimyroides tangerinum TaxID=2488728 RepID=A0A3P3W757_9FLAO|nr:metallophosphoesterase [Paenimyroides tangerinum]RRJ90127.1 metallophosphoesterase [Paenimyroides tangerinum]